MNNDKDQDQGQQQDASSSNERQKQHSSAFNETKQRDEKSTKNIEEEAHLEQERKEAMTERD